MADVTDATFQTDVLDRSNTVPVVVDLWAPWCGPCKTLGPILEKVIAATEGKVELAKVDVDQNPQTAQAFQVQGIPAVYALKDGAVVDGFTGAQGEREVQAFVDKLLPTDADVATDEALLSGDEDALRAILAETPDHPEAATLLAAILADRGDNEEATELLARIPETPETRRIAAVIRTGAAGAEGDTEAKLTALLPKVKTDDDARQEFVDLLELMGPEDPRTADYRKRLTSALF